MKRRLKLTPACTRFLCIVAMFGLLLACLAPAVFADERKFVVMLAVPRKSWPPTTGVPVPTNLIYRHYFDRDSQQAVPDDIEIDSFAEY